MPADPPHPKCGFGCGVPKGPVWQEENFRQSLEMGHEKSEEQLAKCVQLRQQQSARCALQTAERRRSFARARSDEMRWLRYIRTFFSKGLDLWENGKPKLALAAFREAVVAGYPERIEVHVMAMFSLTKLRCLTRRRPRYEPRKRVRVSSVVC